MFRMKDALADNVSQYSLAGTSLNFPAALG
jgi:hypothetical protein